VKYLNMYFCTLAHWQLLLYANASPKKLVSCLFTPLYSQMYTVIYHFINLHGVTLGNIFQIYLLHKTERETRLKNQILNCISNIITTVLNKNILKIMLGISSLQGINEIWLFSSTFPSWIMNIVCSWKHSHTLCIHNWIVHGSISTYLNW
jgi:hypothetical protein